MKFGDWVDDQAYAEFLYGHTNRRSLFQEEYERSMNRVDRLQAIAMLFGVKKYDYYNRYEDELAFEADDEADDSDDYLTRIDNGTFDGFNKEETSYLDLVNGCYGCKYFHGTKYGGVDFICPVHPSGNYRF
jgi:hypothetical protein